MIGLFDVVGRVWADMRSGQVALPSVSTIPADRCYPVGAAGYPIRRDQMYFSLRVNQMHLAENREWWSTYDPFVVVVAEFGHGNERIAVPKVIGPSLIQKQAGSDQPRYGVVLLNQLVTGPHPYRGGDVDVSVALYKVQRENHARALLKVVDTLSAALGAPGDMGAIAKTGGALLAGVEGLLGLKETIYLAGQRISVATSPLDPFLAGFSALIAPPTPDPARLHVNSGELQVEGASGKQSYLQSDFVLLSIVGYDERGDENQLPFYPLKVAAITALWDSDEGEKRAKANLISAYQEMRKSPDMTAAEAGRLFEAWLKEFETEKSRLERTHSMPLTRTEAKPNPLAREFGDAVRRLAL